MRQAYKPSKLDITFKGKTPAKWKYRAIVKGTEFLYTVKDENFDRLNQWTFRLQVPADAYGDIIVQPVQTPSKNVWAGIARSSVVFTRATKEGYKSHVYCKMFLANPAGSKTGASRGARPGFPKWFQTFRWRMRLKKTLTTTLGHDHNAQVIFAERENHALMIKIFFALKVWVLASDYSLD